MRIQLAVVFQHTLLVGLRYTVVQTSLRSLTEHIPAKMSTQGDHLKMAQFACYVSNALVAFTFETNVFC